MSGSDSDRDEGLSGDSDSERTQDETEDLSSNSLEDGKSVSGESKQPVLSHAASLPCTGEPGSKPKLERSDTTAKRKNSVSWSPFGAFGKAIGGGVQVVGSATKAVGSGVVKGTQAVGSGVANTANKAGSAVVGTAKGVVSAAETVGSGVVSAAESVGSGVVSAAETVQSGVVKTGEAVGNVAVSGVTAVGEATKRTASSVSRSVDDSTTWVREKRRSVILHAKPYKQHSVDEGETIGIIAAKYKTTVEDILVLNKDKLDEECELVVGMSIKVPVREKRRSSRKETSETFLTNLSKAFAEDSENIGDTEQVESRCLVLCNHSVGPATSSPGYLILERNVLVLTWGKDNPVHLEEEMLEGVSLLYGEDELTGYNTTETQLDADPPVISTSFSEADVFPAWEEQPELEDVSLGTDDISPRHCKTEDSDDVSNNESVDNSNNESLKNMSFEETFSLSELSRGKSEDRPDSLADGTVPDENRTSGGRKRSHKRRTLSSSYRRQSLMFEDTMATYLIIRLKKETDIEKEKVVIREDRPDLLSTESPEFLLRIPNEIVVRLFGLLSRQLSHIYGEVQLEEMTSLVVITMDSLMSGSGDMKVCNVLGKKNSVDDSLDLNLPDMDQESEVLEDVDISALSQHLPPRLINHSWMLTFSTERDGFALSTLYRKMQEIDSPVLLVIQDTEDNLFGSFLSGPILITDAFTGTGECWLYTFASSQLEIYHWTKQNEFFCKGCSSSLAIGAGEGQFGIWFDEDLNFGRSQECLTFGNPALTPNQDFRVKIIECWSFMSTN